MTPESYQTWLAVYKWMLLAGYALSLAVVTAFFLLVWNVFLSRKELQSLNRNIEQLALDLNAVVRSNARGTPPQTDAPPVQKSGDPMQVTFRETR